jgi:hypothetical protein
MRLTNRIGRLAAVFLSVFATVCAVAWPSAAADGQAPHVAARGYARYTPFTIEWTVP